MQYNAPFALVMRTMLENSIVGCAECNVDLYSALREQHL